MEEDLTSVWGGIHLDKQTLLANPLPASLSAQAEELTEACKLPKGKTVPHMHLFWYMIRVNSANTDTDCCLQM